MLKLLIHILGGFTKEEYCELQREKEALQNENSVLKQQADSHIEKIELENGIKIWII